MHLVHMYKIISVRISLYLTVFEILRLKLEKRGDEKEKKFKKP